MARLFGFDYKSPYYYMVTLKALKGVERFCEIGPSGIIELPISLAFHEAIRVFSKRWRCLEEISPYVIMPDHIHLMVKIRNIPDRVALGVIVSQLSKALRAAYWNTLAEARKSQNPHESGIAVGASAPTDIFSKDWHDWIVKKRGQLAAFREYIKENPTRAYLRRKNAAFFGAVREVEFLGRTWYAYGNLELLKLPVITPIKGHRSTKEGDEEWNRLLQEAGRIGPGGAGISTFMSPLEKACGNAIAKAGGKFIVLSPEGFGERWHPPREKERFCAAGRMLYLSLYPADTKKPSRSDLYERCHEMIDLAKAKLG